MVYQSHSYAIKNCIILKRVYFGQGFKFRNRLVRYKVDGKNCESGCSLKLAAYPIVDGLEPNWMVDFILVDVMDDSARSFEPIWTVIGESERPLN